MAITIDGAGTITGLSATGISAQPVFAGQVLQVVSATTSVEVATTAVDTFVSSGLSASITPRSTGSKIVIIASQNIGLDGTSNVDVQVNLGIFRESTLIFGKIGFDDLRANALTDFVCRIGISFLDLPATTSAVTYTTRGSLRTGGSGVVRMQYSNTPSSIILMEIAG